MEVFTKRVVVTGGSGFMGTRLVAALLEAGHRVTIYDKRPSTVFPEMSIVADVRDKDQLASAFHGMDVIYHLAAEHADDVRPTSLYYEVNVKGAEHVVFAAVSQGIQRIVFTSTVALYGLNAGIPDEGFPVRPFNEYGTSKLQAEEVFRRWAGEDQARSLVIVRPAVIFGEGNKGNVFNLLSQIASRHFIMVGKGANRKSMGYVENISAFLVHVLTMTPGTHVYNYADKPDLTAAELVDIARRKLNQKGRILRIPYWIGLTGGYLFDLAAVMTERKFPISSIRIKKFCAGTRIAADKLRETGFIPRYSLEQGLERMIAADFQSDSET
ncbi:MAG: NAD-dependent epimerase/dehydratase family protein [Thermodesulfobacteriota bacterium]